MEKRELKQDPDLGTSPVYIMQETNKNKTKTTLLLYTSGNGIKFSLWSLTENAYLLMPDRDWSEGFVGKQYKKADNLPSHCVEWVCNTST